jgi:phosphoribosylaminoimidazolecarboxamide formyltransferase/IMP cyclohydrolase
MSDRKIRTALISVFYKDGLEPIVRKLHELGIRLISTGGTESFIRSCHIPVTSVEELTGFPEILSGRVKTLQPAIFGGILGIRSSAEHVRQMQEHKIPEIDLVIVDLYPFEETLASTDDEAEIIERIDIGGVSLIRAAAKNFNDVLVCASREDYAALLTLLDEKRGSTSEEDRRLFATKAFNQTSHYDTAIFNYFNRSGDVAAFKQSILKSRSLRYGENPHQQGVFYGDLDLLFSQVHGKEISYNNLVDIDAAIRLIDEFENPACAVIKHTNACGCAEAEDVAGAWQRALAGDPVSAFGGVVVFNRTVDASAASRINEIFFEVIIAPGYEDEALATLRQKKNRIILVRKTASPVHNSFRSILGGVIRQNADTRLSSVQTWKVVTGLAPTGDQAADLLFAEKCVKHLKSNAIVLVKNRQLIGMGCGQTSRIDALRQAVSKARSSGFDLNGSVLGSDAFFPFNDSVKLAGEAGVKAIIQPGGSVRDQDSIEACNQSGIAMVFTGLRHFLH